MLSVEIGGATLGLLPERAVFLPEAGALLVADAHIGKAASFRHLGVPVPRGTTTETLAGLSALIARTGARRVVFLGDLLHSARGRADTTFTAVARWRERHAGLALTLVRGNHDLQAGDPPPGWGIELVEEPLHLGPLALCHHPQPVARAYVLAGHLHPCIRLGGRAHDRLRLPCFHFSAEVGVLPAFGAFTGMHPVRPAPGDRVFVAADDSVRELGR
jgi:DNA ligase-associated metallophosphoesterase